MTYAAAIAKDTITEFVSLQNAMAAAKRENASETYGILKERYIILKATLMSIGVNLTEIDRIKE